MSIPKKILVFKIGALGDVLMTTPFLRELRKKEKSAIIEFLVGKSASQVLVGNKYIDNIIVFDDEVFKDIKVLKFLKIVLKIRRKNYDIVYVLDKHWVFAFSSFLFGIKERVGFLRDRLSKSFLTKFVKYDRKVRHEVDYYLSLIGMDKKEVNKKLYFNLTENIVNKVKKWLENQKIKSYVVAVNDGGVNGIEDSAIRMLPEDKFRELVVRLSSRYNVLLVGGPNLRNYYKKFLVNKNIMNLAGRFSVPESMVIMKFAKRVYTTDCGPMHMAACVNENITCFFGPTNPKRKAPFVKNLKVYWFDKDIYEVDYELYGKIPRNKKFFKRLDIKKIRL